jgi:hypothetical protein
MNQLFVILMHLSILFIVCRNSAHILIEDTICDGLAELQVLWRSDRAMSWLRGGSMQELLRIDVLGIVERELVVGSVDVLLLLQFLVSVEGALKLTCLTLEGKWLLDLSNSGLKLCRHSPFGH